MPKTVEQVIGDLITELERSIIIHGDWSDYDQSQMVVAIMGEANEFFDAVKNSDEVGPHGMIAEARQLAVVCIKYLVSRDQLL